MLSNINALNALKAPARTVEGRANAYNTDGSTSYIFKSDDYLKEFKVERIGDNTKFFGFGVTHKANVKVRDKNRQITLNTNNQIYPYYIDRSTGSAVGIYPYPKMDITEVNRDENTNELSITCYDRLNKAAAHKVEELALTAPYTIQEFAVACANLLGLAGVVSVNVADSSFSTSYDTGANFVGTETIRDALDDVAEATQTIYYIDRNNKLTFRRLDKDGEALLSITKEDYIDLDSKTNRRLTTLVSATELGDNISVTTGESGTTQYIRNNAFWDLREDRAELLESALDVMGGFTLNQFECSWRGNYLLEIGDKIALVTKDNQKVFSFILDDTITYNGFLSEETRWSYEESENEDADNPTSIGEALKQTFAKVDKANKKITILASDVSDKVEAISQIQLDTEEIKASVNRVEANTQDSIVGINSELETINKKVELAMTSEEVELKIQQEKESGAEKVTTSTGFKFDEEGLTISKSEKEIETKITEDGMTVYRNEDEVLVANNEGVKAEDLHATTYLIIGNNSRFEDYGSGRTGCFWIGG